LISLFRSRRAALPRTAPALVLGFVLATASMAEAADARAGDDTKRRPAATRRASSSKPKSAAETAEQQRRRQRSRRSKPSKRRAPAAPVLPALRWTTPASATALASDLGYMLDARVRRGQWGAMVVSLTRGDTLYARNADATMQPASTMKLMTAAIALDRFGPDYQFSTDVLRDGSVGADGTLSGNLVLRGDGDPSFSNRWMRGDANAPVAELARQVAAAGIKRVSGDIVGDASAFDAKTVPDGWQSRYLQSGYAARVSALSINENLVWVSAYPGQGKGPARVVLEPATTTMPLQANVRTVPGSSGGSVRVTRRADGTVLASGWIGSRSVPRKYSFVIEDPATFTAGAFRAALQAQGIQVDGGLRLATAPSGAVTVATVRSQPLARLVSVMNRESINHFAELIFRNAARGPRREREGNAQSGEALLQEYLTRKAGVAPGAVKAADGSGLSVLDQVTPRAMVQLLAHAHESPWGPAFHASLPVAGESELLRNRMKFTPAQGNLHAKTGTTNTVISLAGYVTARDGEVLAFAFIYNGTDRWNARSTIDVMGATLAGFVRD
jgi:D-alanyl-D-alanine carboxypeptidase/D-alanyl-D-alanine-endopeptidase (penicillin-binding protein 4)